MLLGDFYEVLLTKLGTISELKHKDMYFGQYDTELDEEEELPFNFPAAFIGFEEIAWETHGNKSKKGILNFTVHVVSEVIAETSSRETLAIRSNALDHLDVLDKIHNVLQNANGTNYGSIDHNGLISNKVPGGDLIAHVMSFRTQLTYNYAKRTYTLLNPQPAQEIQTDLPDPVVPAPPAP
jgi:hypothetical protein